MSNLRKSLLISVLWRKLETLLHMKLV